MIRKKFNLKSIYIYILFLITWLSLVVEIILYKNLNNEDKKLNNLILEFNKIETDIFQIKSSLEEWKKYFSYSYVCYEKENCILSIINYVNEYFGGYNIQNLIEESISQEQGEILCIKLTMHKSDATGKDLDMLLSLLNSETVIIEYNKLELKLDEGSINAEGRICKIYENASNR